MKITTYKQLNQTVGLMSHRYIHFMVVQSRGGLGKTYTIRTAFDPKDYLLFTGHATPLKIYQELYQHPHKIVIFDDVDAMLQNKTTVALLKQICTHEENKLISYSTTRPLKADDGTEIKSSFTSNNKVILICNELSNAGEDIKALLSRAIHYTFDPTDDEILACIKKFGREKDIITHLKKNIQHITPLNLRVYTTAEQIKLSGGDWVEYLHNTYSSNPYDIAYQQIRGLPYKQQVRQWQKLTGTSASTLDRYRRNK